VKQIVKKVEAIPIGLPWDTFEDGGYPKVTPLPNQKRIAYMRKLIDDAVAKGAKVVNKDGGTIIGGAESTLMVPAVLYPVTKDMDVYYEEQFGPVIPIVAYDSLDLILEYGRNGEYGQQVSIFTSQENASTAANLLDQFSAIFGKININSQCGRSPDTLPFSGRRSSAMGVMSAKYAVREFSVPTVVAYKETESTPQIVEEIQKASNFMEKL
jgi:glyceraldehyde-3-phosphate dehydrogenase (NADP+)